MVSSCRLYLMPSLTRQASAALKLMAQDGAKAQFLPMQRDTLILWGMYNGWSTAVIVRRTGLGIRTVLASIERFRSQPWLIFRVPVLLKVGSGRRPFWRCEACNTRLPNISEHRAMAHVAGHFISPLDLKTNGVMNPWGD